VLKFWLGAKIVLNP